MGFVVQNKGKIPLTAVQLKSGLIKKEVEEEQLSLKQTTKVRPIEISLPSYSNSTRYLLTV